MAAERDRLSPFVSFSSILTGFSEFRLLGTGQAEEYLQTAIDVVGTDVMDELLDRARRIADDDRRERSLRTEILSHELLGPIARNIIKMWFVGTWYQLPADWREAYGSNERDVTHVVSPAAYTEGLLWPNIDANPPGAKGPGYGTWASPPRIPDPGS